MIQKHFFREDVSDSDFIGHFRSFFRIEIFVNVLHFIQLQLPFILSVQRVALCLLCGQK